MSEQAVIRQPSALSRIRAIPGRLYRGEVSLDFVGRRKLWYTISGVILLVSIVALLFRGLNYSVDFKGGEIYKFKTAAPVSQSQVSRAFQAAGSGTSITVQRAGAGWQVQTPVFSNSAAVNQRIELKIQSAVTRTLGIVPGSNSLQAVGASWGAQILKKALEALIAFLIVIILYLSVAFEWRMATAALVALAHDILITVGVYALIGFEVSPATVIGLLTILGYSLYDTVVVFDKVRENTAGLLATRRTGYSQAANLALNQTLVRSINTSVIALLPVISILAVGSQVLGNGELKDLALVLFVGMLSGTYSSICIATPVLADLKEREPEYKQLAKQVEQRATSTKRQEKAAARTDQPAVDLSAAVDLVAADPDADAADETASVGAGRPASRPAAGPRQQPRRQSAAQRRPAGKKRRR
jgi:preprotein translocase subunit SecF